MSEEGLVDRVRLALSASIHDWVLFSNGTVIVFDDPRPEDNIKDKAITLMREFGPVHVGTEAGDFDMVSLNETDGWLQGMDLECILTSIQTNSKAGAHPR